MKCKYHAIISQLASYSVCDEFDNFLGYSDTIGEIEYDENMNKKEYDGDIEVISVDETAWN